MTLLFEEVPGLEFRIESALVQPSPATDLERRLAELMKPALRECALLALASAKAMGIPPTVEEMSERARSACLQAMAALEKQKPFAS